MRDRVPAQNMPEDVDLQTIEGAAEAADSARTRIYEAGYQILPTVREEDIEGIVASIRAEVEAHGGSLIAEGAPVLMRLSYEIPVRIEGKFTYYDRGYFGWLKFEAPVAAAEALTSALKGNRSVMRSIVFKTVREDTRAQLKTGLREVKRSDTIKTSPRREERVPESEISEADLEKAIKGITFE